MADPAQSSRTQEDRPSRRRQVAVILLAVGGLLVYLWSGSILFKWPYAPSPGWSAKGRDALVVALAALLCWPRPVRRVVTAVLDHVRNPSPRARRLTTLALWVLASLYCFGTAARQHRDFDLRNQDEMMYLVQTQQVASGHLWLPAHPMAEFFQTFYIFVRPVYAAMHFPGLAVLYAPTVWLHVPPWVLALLIAGGVVGMTYRVVSELVDGVAGVLSAMLVVALPSFRQLSLMVLPYLPMALVVLVTLWAYLRWRRRRGVGWAVVLGVLAGFSAILRPLDTICFGLPLTLAMLWDLRGAGSKRIALTAGLVVACTIPFVSLQLIADHGITGHWLRAPVQEYHRTFWPGIHMGLNPRVDETAPPPTTMTTLPQFKANYQEFVVAQVTQNSQVAGVVQRYANTIAWGLPLPILVVLLPIGLLGLTDRRRWVWAAGLLVFPVAYLTFLYVQHYVAILAPGLAFLVVLGAGQVARAFPRGRGFLTPWLAVAIVGLAVAALPEVARFKDKTTKSPAMEAFKSAQARIKRPALVFFHYDPSVPELWKHEQTYNYQTARIDDAAIVRAQDLGDRNVELINYYAKVQPRRYVYRFDQKTGELTQLGKVSELASSPAPPR